MPATKSSQTSLDLPPVGEGNLGRGKGKVLDESGATEEQLESALAPKEAVAEERELAVQAERVKAFERIDDLETAAAVAHAAGQIVDEAPGKKWYEFSIDGKPVGGIGIEGALDGAKVLSRTGDAKIACNLLNQAQTDTEWKTRVEATIVYKNGGELTMQASYTQPKRKNKRDGGTYEVNFADQVCESKAVRNVLRMILPKDMINAVRVAEAKGCTTEEAYVRLRELSKRKPDGNDTQ